MAEKERTRHKFEFAFLACDHGFGCRPDIDRCPFDLRADPRLMPFSGTAFSLRHKMPAEIFEPLAHVGF